LADGVQQIRFVLYALCFMCLEGTSLWPGSDTP